MIIKKIYNIPLDDEDLNTIFFALGFAERQVKKIPGLIPQCIHPKQTFAKIQEIYRKLGGK